ncbi:unnamed protein product [Acanthosepion pharaonis]|uniref:Uncharacterized protein n=1 Tax=Acanthosepion pharaonis TaxID=158019 RepID=A0A812DXC4_ACAPH|nr:unnamed protein product [Sepia pharaonis]
MLSTPCNHFSSGYTLLKLPVPFIFSLSAYLFSLNLLLYLLLLNCIISFPSIPFLPSPLLLSTISLFTNSSCFLSFDLYLCEISIFFVAASTIKTTTPPPPVCKAAPNPNALLTLSFRCRLQYTPQAILDFVYSSCRSKHQVFLNFSLSRFSSRIHLCASVFSIPPLSLSLLSSMLALFLSFPSSFHHDDDDDLSIYLSI